MKKIFIILGIILIAAGAALYLIIIKPKETNKKEEKEKIVYTDALLDQNVVVNNELNVEFGRIKYLSDYILVNDGTLDDAEITYDDLGEVNVNFSYKDINNKKNYRFLKFNIVDTTKPFISVPSSKTISVKTEIDFIYEFFCADNHDRNVERYLEGDLKWVNLEHIMLIMLLKILQVM